MSRVTGVEAFRDALKGFEDCYALIGGGACSILFDEVGQSFRATSDLVVVVLTDHASPEFGRAFWNFIRSGAYECWRSSEGKAVYYRFVLSEGSDLAGRFLKQIELFARHPDFELVDEQSEIAPVSLGEDISSLSAIVLDEGYYDFIGKNVLVVDGIPLTRALSVIPLKMRAHIDLNRRHVAGEHVSEKDLRKHRADVCRLVDLLPSEARLPLEGPMREDAVTFLDDFSAYAKRETSAKKRRMLAKVDEIIRQTYL